MEKLKCPKCGCEELAFTTIKTEEESTNSFFKFLGAMAIINLCLSIITIPILLNIIKTPSEIFERLYNTVFGFIIYKVISDIANLGIFSYAVLKLLPKKSKEEIVYICKNCGNNDKLENLSIKVE